MKIVEPVNLGPKLYTIHELPLNKPAVVYKDGCSNGWVGSIVIKSEVGLMVSIIASSLKNYHTPTGVTPETRFALIPEGTRLILEV